MKLQREAATEASCLYWPHTKDSAEEEEHQAHTKESHGAPCTLAPWRARGLCETKMTQLSKLLQLPLFSLPLFSLMISLMISLLFLHFLLTLLELPLNQ